MFKNYKHHCFKGQTIFIKCSCHSDSIRRGNNRHILNHDMSNIQDRSRIPVQVDYPQSCALPLQSDSSATIRAKLHAGLNIPLWTMGMVCSALPSPTPGNVGSHMTENSNLRGGRKMYWEIEICNWTHLGLS